MELSKKIYTYGDDENVDGFIRLFQTSQDIIFAIETDIKMDPIKKKLFLAHKKNEFFLAAALLEKSLFEEGYIDYPGSNFFAGDDGIYLMYDKEIEEDISKYIYNAATLK